MKWVMRNTGWRGVVCWSWLWVAVLIWAAVGCGQEQVRAAVADPLRVSVQRLGAEVRLTSEGATNAMHRLESSENLGNWTERARGHAGLIEYPAVVRGREAMRAEFFRVVSSPLSAEDDWKNQVRYDGDPFLSDAGAEGVGGSRWIKFAIRLDMPDRVFFQDSRRYLFHYEFATRRLVGFGGLTPEEVDRVSLYTKGQRLVFGTVVLPPDPGLREYAIELVGREPYPVAQVASWFRLVRSVIAAPAEVRAYYFPTYEQGSMTTSDVAYFAAEGIEVSSPMRWVTASEGYSEGWALGRLVYIPAGEIDAAFGDGRLRYSDILMTDGIPAEIPRVAGVVSIRPATPNSHVAILSRSFGVPFAFVAEAEEQGRLRGWHGQEVFLTVGKVEGRWDVRAVNVQGQLSDEQRRLVSEAKRPTPLEIRGVETAGSISVAVRGLTSGDGVRVGGKAANFGAIIRAIPEHTHTNAIAFTFDLWNAYLDRVLLDGRTLRQRIAEVLARHAFPPDMARLRVDLAMIRGWIRDEVEFSVEHQAAILGALRGFETGKNLRFRSSTNVEDTELFSGAGLYDSYSGCVLDELDADTAGPCGCDPSEPKERGVFRALRRVYASFYNDNAFLERLRYGVDERRVGMAVLVHPSVPDEIELANGVATLRVSAVRDSAARRIEGELVSQPGAVSVANPDANALPEVISLARGPGTPFSMKTNRSSSVLPLGGLVLRGAADYELLLGLLERVSVEYAASIPDRQEFLLDFEYKKVRIGAGVAAAGGGEQLVVKQVREIPRVQERVQVPPIQLRDAGRLAVFQHHGKDLFSNHRLKSAWEFRSLVMTNGLSTGYNYQVSVAYQDGERVRGEVGPVTSFPGGEVGVNGKSVAYRWNWGVGESRRDYTMTATYGTTLTAAQPLPLDQATLVELTARYAVPQPRVVLDERPRVEWVTNETTRLVPLEKIISGSLLRNRSFAARGMKVETAYRLSFLKFGVAGVSIFDGKSFPLVAWRGTTITGLTTKPIQLVGEFSQTYDSTRHNFQETFLFEPRLEEGLDARTREELDAAKIRGILVQQFTADDRSQPVIWIWTTDNQVRVVPAR